TGGDEHRRRPVVQRARVACRYGAALAESGPEAAQGLHARVGPGALVGGDYRGLPPRDDAHGDDLLGEAVRCDRGRGLAMAGERVRVLLIARYVALLGQVLRGLTHRLGAVLLGHARVHETPAE